MNNVNKMSRAALVAYVIVMLNLLHQLGVKVKGRRKLFVAALTGHWLQGQDLFAAFAAQGRRRGVRLYAMIDWCGVPAMEVRLVLAGMTEAHAQALAGNVVPRTAMRAA